MNNCELYQELISRLVDGELGRDEYAALEAHMENCAECSAMYAVFASLSDIIGGEDEPLPEDLHENIMAGVRRSAMINHNRRRLSKPVRNALAAAACAALVLFASRGLAPEKAADMVLTKDQTAAMDVQMEEAAPAPEAVIVSASPAPAQSPAASPVSEPAVTPTPVATALPTKDIYLETEKNEAKPAAENKNNTTNSVLVTPKPQEIPVDTPTVTSTPKPTASPSPVVTPTAVPETPAPVQPTETPAAVAEVTEETTSQPVDSAQPMMAAESDENNQPAPAAEPAHGDVAVAAAEPEETEPAATETPSLTKRFFSFFGMARPDAVAAPEAAPESEGTDSVPAEAAAEPAPVSEESPAPSEEPEEEKNLIKLETVEKLTELEDMLDGEDAALPEEEADEEYCFVIAEPEEGLEDYSISVYIYGESVYYVQIFSDEESISCISPCTLEDFEKFMESLSDKEKGIEPSPSPAVSAEPSPTASPEAATASPKPEQSTAPSPEAAAKQ